MTDDNFDEMVVSDDAVEPIDRLNRLWLTEFFIEAAVQGNLGSVAAALRDGLPGLVCRVEASREVMAKLRALSESQITLKEFWQWYDDAMRERPRAMFRAPFTPAAIEAIRNLPRKKTH